MLLCLLSRNILWIRFLCLPGNFALKKGGDFWWIFSGLRFPRNEARKLLEKFGENSEQNSGAKFGTKIRKIRGAFVLQLFWPKEMAGKSAPSQHPHQHSRQHPELSQHSSQHPRQPFLDLPSLHSVAGRPVRKFKSASVSKYPPFFWFYVNNSKAITVM